MNETNATAAPQAFAAPIATVPDAFIEALKAGQEIAAAASAVMGAIVGGTACAALPEDINVHDLEDYMPMRRRPRGTMTTRFINPFADYAETHAQLGSVVFVNPDNMTATAVLDLGTPEQPGHADNKALLELNKTAAYASLLGLTIGARSQQDVAEFLEDWADNLQCYSAEGMIQPQLAIAAVRKITIESAQKVHSEEQSLSASRSAFESIKATSADPLPTTVHFNCRAYADLAERTFVLRLSILTSESKPKLTLRIQKAEAHNEEMATELAARISDAVGTTLPVLIGRYSKSN